MEFEYDENKSNINKEKHGIDFEEALLLWLDNNRIEIKANSTNEFRMIIIGKIKEKYWSAIITYRQNKIRIISVRRSRKQEVNFYES
ncbi:BrnT family toxin [Geminocystis sp. GBBB08]|uniref:BrnT family toxin n=1 Tax=Geminocystis sp. GBBB08 TaxID=2604140 RepID=UPI0027E3380A|nr:BrnT family toxin [Geminocystis sp. GBBB08]MBL1209795.1 BrnT family toxin [Geminocystis sp. GBBB08]